MAETAVGKLLKFRIPVYITNTECIHSYRGIFTLTRCIHSTTKDPNCFSVSRTRQGKTEIELDNGSNVLDEKDLVRSVTVSKRYKKLVLQCI
jgi:hypothetical protein